MEYLSVRLSPGGQTFHFSEHQLVVTKGREALAARNHPCLVEAVPEVHPRPDANVVGLLWALALPATPAC